MKITLIGATQPLLQNNDGRQDSLYEFAAKTMATCVSNKPVDQMQEEALEKTLTRLDDTLKQRHHSGYDMIDLVFAFEDVSKIFCMYLNNLHLYTTEETSGRHKELVLPSKEKVAYDYFYNKILNHLMEQADDREVSKAELRSMKIKARENARYVTGLDCKTNMTYKTSLRQLNYIYEWTQKFLNKEDYNSYEELVIKDMAEFRDKLESLEINGEKVINPYLKDPYNRQFNLFGNFEKKPESYRYNYEVYYDASSTAIGQLQRHRKIDYTIDNPDKQAEINYYVPKVIQAIEGMTDEWFDKIGSLGNIPQARLVTVREAGNYFDIVDKLKERACNYAQEETRLISAQVADRVFRGMETYDADLSKQLCNDYLNKNRRSFPDYKCVCNNPCKKEDAIIIEMQK